MSATEENKAIVRKFYSAVKTGDSETVNACLHPELLTLEPEGVPYPGAFKGREGFWSLLDTIMKVYSNFSFPDDVEMIAERDWVMAMVPLSITSSETGKSLDVPVAEVFKFKDKQIILLQPYYFDTLAVMKTCGKA